MTIIQKLVKRLANLFSSNDTFEEVDEVKTEVKIEKSESVKNDEGCVDIFNYQNIQGLPLSKMESIEHDILRGNPEGEYGSRID